ncbi:hypothetical protein CP533_5199 [Ophiocordyceps camponoti-saundersi (nom. inval.)]|nr:hypothetical protein CP533_5199 [Ophiocordyceps camponoti-saundersi (nom. inval.)]
MSHLRSAQQGIAAVQDKLWDVAAEKLTTALNHSQNPVWLLARSRALVGLEKFQPALEDAELAWHVAYQRNSRLELMNAQYRRAVAYYRLGRLADADCCCLYAMRISKGFPAIEDPDPKLERLDDRSRWTVRSQEILDESKTDSFNAGHDIGGTNFDLSRMTQTPAAKAWRQASILRLQILRAMEALPEDDEARVVTASLKPEYRPYEPTLPVSNKPEEQEQQQNEEKINETAPSPSLRLPAAAINAPQTTSVEPRIQEFQTTTSINVSIFSKGTDPSTITVNFLPSSVRLESVVCPDGKSRTLRLSLWADIDPSASEYVVTPNKVELKLSKNKAGKWPQLRKDEAESIVEAADGVTNDDDQNRSKPFLPKGDKASLPSHPAPHVPSLLPAYPTSSRSGPKDWDLIASGGGEDDDDEDADVNSFFKKLYGNATPEQRRAMMKSFTESNGTSLSTDWNDVKGRTVETVPPEGMEAKKY